MTSLKLIVVCFLCVLTNVMVYSEDVTINLVGNENSRGFRVGEKICAFISENTDLSIKLISLPGKRATIELIKGKMIQGDLARITEYKDKAPNTIQVQIPTISLPYFVYTNNSLDFKVDGWKSIEKYKLVCLRGRMLWLNKHLKENQPRFDVNSEESALQIIISGRADVFISTPLLVNSAAQKAQLTGKFKQLKPPIFLNHNYAFFNDKYGTIADQFEKGLKQLKGLPLYKEIVTRTK